MLEAVLPLIESDLERAGLLRESLERHGGELRLVWVVTPEEQVAGLAAAFAGSERWRVISEREVLPHRPLRVTARRKRMGGETGHWYFQQLLKLAACARSEAEYCVTLDADVIALRGITEETVAPGGRAISQIEPGPHSFPEWYEGAARVLGMPPALRHDAVTPAVLRPSVCRDLIAHLEARKGRLDRTWASYLMRRPPWSEYALYNTFLQGTGRFDDLHVRVERPVLYGDAVWYAEDFASWRAGRLPDRPLFTLVQSAAGIPIDDVRRRLAAVDEPA